MAQGGLFRSNKNSDLMEGYNDDLEEKLLVVCFLSCDQLNRGFMNAVRKSYDWLLSLVGRDTGTPGPGAKHTIRDFIYLDTERVRSYLAQLEGGYQAERGDSRSHDIGVSQQGEANAFAAKASGGGSYQYGYASNVNYQAHDEIFERLYELLKSTDRINDAKTGSPWNLLTFEDGEFVAATCAVKIIDLGGLKTQMTVVPKLWENITRMQNAQARKSGNPSQAPNPFDPKAFSQMADLLEQTQILLYGDSPVLMKLFPDLKQPEKVFHCSARNVFFREQPEEIARHYGRFFNAGWKCLVLMNHRYFVNKPERFVVEKVDASDIGATAEYVQDLFEQQMASVKQRSDVGNATLLALYREI